EGEGRRGRLQRPAGRRGRTVGRGAKGALLVRLGGRGRLAGPRDHRLRTPLLRARPEGFRFGAPPHTRRPGPLLGPARRAGEARQHLQRPRARVDARRDALPDGPLRLPVLRHLRLLRMVLLGL
ncbi:MAG: hypothetical protein AVDCRST_MAG25-2451, partial [uncultured Rubrobacteraceae bacterium]